MDALIFKREGNAHISGSDERGWIGERRSGREGFRARQYTWGVTLVRMRNRFDAYFMSTCLVNYIKLKHNSFSY